MTAPSYRLWWLNNQYRTRLSRGEKCFGLLENLVLARGVDYDDTIAVLLQGLYGLRQQLLRLHDEHRDWRYTYYYQSPFHKRMVAGERDVYRALVHFRRMRARHARALVDIQNGLAALPRPVTSLTYVPSGDLWLHAEHALSQLVAFMDAAGQESDE